MQHQAAKAECNIRRPKAECNVSSVQCSTIPHVATLITRSVYALIKRSCAALQRRKRPSTLHMSYTVSAATLAAVRASISTPVFPRQVALASM